MPIIPINQSITSNNTPLATPSQASGFGEAGVLSLVNSTLLPSHKEQSPPLSDEARQSNAIQKILGGYQNHAQTPTEQAPSTASTPVPLTRAERRRARMPTSAAALTPQFRHQAKEAQETQPVVRPKERAPSSAPPLPLKPPLQFLEKVTPAQSKAEAEAEVRVKVEPEVEVKAEREVEAKAEQAEEEKADEARAPEPIHKRVKRVIAGDKALPGSHLKHAVGQLVTSDSSNHCTAALVGPRHFLTAAHCVTSNSKVCEETKDFKGASVYLNNHWYKCASYSIPNTCIQANASPSDTGPSRNKPIPVQSPERRDVVLCHTSRPVNAGFIMPLMSSADYLRLFPSGTPTKNTEPLPRGFLAGMGRTGADCNGTLSDSLSLSWSQFASHKWHSELNSNTVHFAAHKTYQENKNYQICPGDSGSPLIYYNNQTHTYELIGPLVLGDDYSFFVDEIVSEPYKTWLAGHHIKPWTENQNASLTYYNLTRDEQVRIPFVPLIKIDKNSEGAVVNLEKTGSLNQFVKVKLQNNLTTPNLPTSENTLYSAQSLRYFNKDNTFNHTGIIRTKVPHNETFSWVYYPFMHLDDFSLSSMTQTCKYQWNTSTLDLFEWAYKEAAKAAKIGSFSEHGKSMFGFNITVNSDPADGNITLITNPAYLFNSTQVHCENIAFSEGGHYFHSRSEGPAVSPWPAVIALTTAVSFLLKDG